MRCSRCRTDLGNLTSGFCPKCGSRVEGASNSGLDFLDMTSGPSEENRRKMENAAQLQQSYTANRAKEVQKVENKRKKELEKAERRERGSKLPIILTIVMLVLLTIFGALAAFLFMPKNEAVEPEEEELFETPSENEIITPYDGEKTPEAALLTIWYEKPKGKNFETRVIESDADADEADASDEEAETGEAAEAETESFKAAIYIDGEPAENYLHSDEKAEYISDNDKAEISLLDNEAEYKIEIVSDEDIFESMECSISFDGNEDVLDLADYSFNEEEKYVLRFFIKNGKAYPDSGTDEETENSDDGNLLGDGVTVSDPSAKEQDSLYE